MDKVYRLHGPEKASLKGSGLLSLEEGYPSMGKMPLRGKQGGSGANGSAVEHGVELQQLVVRQRQQEALEKDDRFTEASVEIVVRSVEQIPLEFELHGGWVVQLFRGITKRFVEILDELQER